MNAGEDTQDDEDQVEPFSQAGGEQFKMHNNEDRDRDYQVCSAVLPLSEI